MDKMIDKYTTEITGNLRDNLEALVLVGSYARGEGVDGFSDVEFWAVAKDLTNTKKCHIDKNVAVGFTSRSHLSRLKPYIYTVEVKKFGKVLYGDKDILSLIPDYSFEDIVAIDGFILLNNRIAEQLILLNKIEDTEIINQYEFAKGYIQLVNALLALNGRYRGLYPEKLREFMSLSKCHKVTTSQEFIDRVQQAFTLIKAQPQTIVSNDEALNKWLELRECFRAVWLENKNMLVRLIKKPLQFWIYSRVSKLYFSDHYTDRWQRDYIIRKWEKFVK